MLFNNNVCLVFTVKAYAYYYERAK